MNEYEKQYNIDHGKEYVITLGKGYFQYWGFPNIFTLDWQLAYRYKNLRTVTNAIKKLVGIHGEGFGYKQVKEFMEAL